MTSMQLFAVAGLPSIQPGDDVASLIVARLAAAGEALHPGDILVIAQKIISKAEGRLVRLDDVQPSALALELSATVGKDPRVIQVVLDDSNEVLRVRRGLLVVEQRSGWVCANAGVDRSNVQADDAGEHLALLPADADASADALRARLAALTGVTPAGRDHQRQPWPRLAHRHGRHGHRVRGAAADLESARPARPVWL